MYPDYLELLQCLKDHRVEYLIIGGYAVLQYTEPRYTKDLDLWVNPTESNAKKIIKALKVFGAPIENLTVKDLSTPGLVYVFGIPPIRVDILNKATGCKFTTAWSAKEVFEIEGVKANFISRKNLIKLKQSAGRPQDLADLVNLKK